MVGQSAIPAAAADPVERVTQGARVLLVTPYSLDGNPYVPQLVEALRSEGSHVEIAPGQGPLLLWRSLRGKRAPDIVHLQWHHPYLTAETLPGSLLRTVLFFAQWATLRALGARFVWTVHNVVEHERRHPRWELAAARLLARAADGIIAHCSNAAAEVAAAYRVPVSAITVVPHGPIRLPKTADRAEARRSLDVAEDEVLLLSFGRIRPYKGTDRLLQAFRRVDQSRLKLVVAGFPDDPGFAARLRSEAGSDPRVRLRLESIPDEELSRLLEAADAVVLSYRASLTSGAAVLAAAHERPVIGPRLGCLAEFPPDAALLYEPGSLADLERVLAATTTAPLRSMGAAARDYVDRFPWDSVARRTTELYRSVRGGQRPGAGRRPPSVGGGVG